MFMPLECVGRTQVDLILITIDIEELNEMNIQERSFHW